MKNRLLKTAAMCLCAVMIITGSAFVLAAGGNEKDTSTEEKDAAAETLGISYEPADAEKEETVYVISAADGSTKNIISSCHLKNPEGKEMLTDVSDLENIENVKGDEGFDKTGDGGLKWTANGKDIYYRGTSRKTLPVEIAVTYTLDGKKVSPDEIAGKSGKVTIRFDYKNNEYKSVEIGGKEERIYVPFAVLSGAVLDNEVFSNIEVKNGKAINDGDRTAVIGWALPGMQENAALAKEDFEIPSYVEITADAKDFRLDMTLSVALNDVFANLDFEGADSLSGIAEQITKVTDAMAQLVDGSGKLYEGIDTLYEKSGELKTGVDRLADGASQINDGAAALAGGAKELSDGTGELSSGAAALDAGAAELKDGSITLASGAADAANGAAALSNGASAAASGAAELSSGANALTSGASDLKAGADALSAGLNELTSNSEALKSGAKTVFATLLSTASTQLSTSGISAPALTIENYADVLNGVIASLDESAVYDQALSQVTAAVEANRALISEQVFAVVREEVRAKVIVSATGMSVEDFDNAVAAGVIDSVKASQIEGAVDAQMTTEEVQGLVAQNTEAQIAKLISDNMASDEVQAKLAAASEGAKSVIALKSSLDSYNSFYLGLVTYASGVDSAAAGALQIASGAASVSDGAVKVSSGASSLAEGNAALASGSGELADGNKALSEGADKLSSGVSALAEGTSGLSEGAAKLESGAAALSSGASDLADGTPTLFNGLLQMKGSVPTLIDGIKRLRDGAKTLSDGIKQFGDEAVGKITEAVSGLDIENLSARLGAVSDAAKSYTSFSGAADGISSSVKFIYRTEAVKIK